MDRYIIYIFCILCQHRLFNTAASCYTWPIEFGTRHGIKRGYLLHIVNDLDSNVGIEGTRYLFITLYIITLVLLNGYLKFASMCILRTDIEFENYTFIKYNDIFTKLLRNVLSVVT